MTRLSVERLRSPKTLTRYWSRRMPSTLRRATCSRVWLGSASSTSAWLRKRGTSRTGRAERPACPARDHSTRRRRVGGRGSFRFEQLAEVGQILLRRVAVESVELFGRVLAQGALGVLFLQF